MHEYSNPKSRWTALINRDPLASNAFVYCVTTTKIYCRPNCPSRLARRANVIFHNTSADAREDGYRACMRCRPSLGEEDVDPQKVAIAKSCAIIDKETQGGAKNGVRELAKEVGFTESHFCRVFKKITRMTVREYRANVSTRKKDVADVAVAPGGKDSVADLQNLDPRISGPLEFDFNAFSFPDRLDEAQFEFNLESGWYDFNGTPDIYPPSRIVAEVPYSGIFDDRYSHSNTEVSSMDATPHSPPLITIDDDLHFPDLGHQFTHII